ncbi:MAG: stress response translation initiation inhibitor YciH [Candidatus Diapherotrites archaeon]
MKDICEKCGLPKNICVCEEIEKETQKIRIRTLSRRFGKIVTIVSGLTDKEQAKELEKTLKRKLACGGTLKGSEIVLQGEHRKKVNEILLKEGFKQELIEA